MALFNNKQQATETAASGGPAVLPQRRNADHLLACINSTVHECCPRPAFSANASRSNRSGRTNRFAGFARPLPYRLTLNYSNL